MPYNLHLGYLKTVEQNTATGNRKYPGKGSHLPDEDHKLASLKSYVSEEEQPPAF